MNEQLDLFASLYEKPKLPKHVRLIECFAGIGAQAKALEILGVDFEHWRTVEWSWQSITAYNAIHMGGRIADTSDLTYEEVLKRISGVSHDYNQPMTDEQLRRKGEAWARELLGRMIANNNVCPDVSRVHAKDLDIREREDNLYILTYSFPCQDLSLAGQMKGFEKGSGTRSGLLWEIERILNECGSELPQVLVMENVPGVCSSNNKGPWQDWLDTLHGMGYTSYFKVINAKDYSIPQNRKRAFLISILGKNSYSFPKENHLNYLLKDFISKEANESYCLPDELVEGFKKDNYWLSESMQKYIVSKDDKYVVSKTVLNPSLAKSITTREGYTRADTSTYISPDCSDDAVVTADEDGFPVVKKERLNGGK